MTLTLSVTKREERGKTTQKLRADGKIPAVVYGPKQEAVPVTIEKVAFDKVFSEAGESSIIKLEGIDGTPEVLVHDVSFDPVKGGASHVDFYAIEAGKELTTDVPLEFIGEAPAIKLGGTLTKALHEVEVTCLPNKLPQHIDVDVSVLVDFEAQIHVRDLVIPEGVTVSNDPDEVVALVQEVTEEVEETPEAVDMSAIEVEKKGKEETEEEAAS